MTKHELKSWPECFKAIVSGEKRHEVREDDRGFSVGDTLFLKEWDPKGKKFSGLFLNVEVTHIDRGPAWGLPKGLVVMSVFPGSLLGEEREG